MYLGVGQHDARPRGVLYCELGLAALACQPPYAARKVLAPQRLRQVEASELRWGLKGQTLGVVTHRCTPLVAAFARSAGKHTELQSLTSRSPQPCEFEPTLTSLISKDSTYKSSNRSSAIASCTSKPASMKRWL